MAWRGVVWRGVRGAGGGCKLLISSASRLVSVKQRFRVSSYQNDAASSVGLMSHPCRTFVENATPAGNSLGNYNASSERGARRSPRSPYIAPFPSLLPCSLSFSLLYGSFISIRLITSPFCLLAWHPNFIPRYHIWATHLLTKTHQPPLDHLLATGGRNYHPQSTPTRSYTVCQFYYVFRCRLSRRPSCEL